MTRPPFLIVALKELRETLRDRRTLVPLIVLPVVLYPAMFLLILQVASSKHSELQAQPSRLWLTPEASALEEALAQISESEPTEIMVGTLDGGLRALGDRDADLVIEAHALDLALGLDDSGRAVLHFDQASERSRLARDRAEAALTRWSEAQKDRRLAARQLPPTLARPLEIRTQNTATAAELGGWLLGQILPVLLVMMVSLGAYYPAVDLTAGERERGTLLTLLTAPVSAVQLVMGKFAAVLLLACLTAAMNIGSVALFFGQGAQLLPEAAEHVEISLSLPAWLGLLTVCALLGAFLSALMMAVAVLARSFKEAQSYLTPVYLLSVVPAVVAQLPGFELTAPLALAPGVNAALLMKALLTGRADSQLTFLVLTSCAIYTAGVLGLAARLFQRESVVAGQASWRELFALGKGGPKVPMGAAEAAGLFAVLFALFFYGSTWIAAVSDLPLLALVALPLVAFVLGPTLLWIRARGLSFGKSLGVHRARPTHWLAAGLLGASAWAPLGWLIDKAQQSPLPLPDADWAAFAELLSPPSTTLGWLVWLGALALTPAICEEVLFRGAILRAFLRSTTPPLAIAAQAALFAAMHLSIHRFAGTFALGIVSGLLAWRARSLGPAVLFHFLNNASALTAAWALAPAEPAEPEVATTAFPPELALVGAAVTVVGLLVLGRPLSKSEDCDGRCEQT